MIFEIFQNTTSISSDFSKICCKICKQAKQTTFFFYAFFKLLASNFLKNFIFFYIQRFQKYVLSCSCRGSQENDGMEEELEKEKRVSASQWQQQKTGISE